MKINPDNFTLNSFVSFLEDNKVALKIQIDDTVYYLTEERYEIKRGYKVEVREFENQRYKKSFYISDFLTLYKKGTVKLFIGKTDDNQNS